MGRIVPVHQGDDCGRIDKRDWVVHYLLHRNARR
jgi:hypothetical protein